MEIIKLKEILVLGAGGAGSWVGFFAAHIGIENIIVFDGAKIDERDIKDKCAFRLKDLGTNKAKALQQIIFEINPKCNVTAHDRFFDSNKDINSLINGTFLCLDDMAIVKQVSLKCKEQNFKHVINPYSMFNASVFREFNNALNITSGLSGWTGSCALAGILACTSMFTSNFETIIDIESLIREVPHVIESDINQLLPDQHE